MVKTKELLNFVVQKVSEIQNYYAKMNTTMKPEISFSNQSKLAEKGNSFKP